MSLSEAPPAPPPLRLLPCPSTACKNPSISVSRPPPAYPTHVPLSVLEKGALSLLSLWGAFRDPRRGDLVAASGETTGLPALHAMRDRMRRSETGQRILAERPLITVGAGVSSQWALRHDESMPRERVDLRAVKGHVPA